MAGVRDTSLNVLEKGERRTESSQKGETGDHGSGTYWQEAHLFKSTGGP